MKAVNILMVLLSNQGHWFGGQAGTVSIRWVADAKQPDAVLVWDLMLGEVRVTGDRVAMAKGGKPSVVQITPPQVRARTTMRWVYRLHERGNGHAIASGEAALEIYPDNLLAGVNKRVKGKRIILWERSGDLAKVLSQAKVQHNKIEHPSKLQLAPADMILVDCDEIDATPFAQSLLLGQARAGASVLVFMQTRGRVLAGYALARRPTPAKLEWRRDHPLLQRFRPEDLQSWLRGGSGDLWAIQLPADEPALEVGYWPRSVEGENPVPIDALLVVKAVGKGRLVLCQIPLGPWQTDPRSQRFLANGLDFLSTRPEPTPPPSQRRIDRPVQPEPVPTITIPSGDTR